ncbi:hypothetical protein G7047_18880 [Diaphorobacter sp. HDW4A]|uniref:hypothetical protein n=1 Tax=Diaphorobacter sp. HDW4A TaxID=2714924 RepID=UPI00140A8D56|nr:hypothetical protein [Diaphorobacter sp. HDW4A]QIL81750.1 hypothetical protein G7047_18880 [Diaphorobacter sp. HDW4A]
MSNPCLILDIACAEYWLPFKGCRRIEPSNQPTVLHPNREVAEAEALRLAAAHPGRRFAVFEIMTAATTIRVPTHVSISGKVICDRPMAQLMMVSEPEIPF